MAREADAALQLKVLRIGFVCAFLLGTMFSIRLLVHGSRFYFSCIVMLLLGAVTVFLLDRKFWMILPATALLTIMLDHFHGSIAFLCAVACFVVFLVRIPFRRDTFVSLPKCIYCALPLFCWVVTVFAMNPPGLLVAGGVRAGARFYVQILLGFCLLFSLPRLVVSGKDCKMLYYVVLAGILSSFIHASLLHFFSSLDEQFDVESESTRYYLGNALPVLVLLMSRYRVVEFFSSPFRFGSALTVFLLVLLSGKRAIFGKMLVLPFVIALLKKKDHFVMVCLAAVAGLAIGVLCLGQGTLFELPQSAQRVLSVFPGKWDYRYERYGLNDDFRRELRMMGFDLIRRSPFFGRKGYSMDVEMLSWVSARKTMYAGHIYVGNWHNAWLSFAADFGIPGFLFACFFIVTMLKEIAYRLSRVPFGSWQYTCALYFSSSIVLQLAISHVSGTSCTLFYYCALHFAMFLLVTNSAPRDIGGVDVAGQSSKTFLKE